MIQETYPNPTVPASRGTEGIEKGYKGKNPADPLAESLDVQLSGIDDFPDESPADPVADPVARRDALAGLKTFRRIANSVANEGLVKLGYRRRQCLWPANPTDVRIFEDLTTLLAQSGRRLDEWINSEAPVFARSALAACNAPPRRALSSSAFYRFSLGRLSAARREGSACGAGRTQWETPVDALNQTNDTKTTKTRRT